VEDKIEIELPPKVKCWRCEGKGFTSRGSDVDPDITIIDNCDCSGGERYVFYNLAAKTREALGPNIKIEVN